MLGVGLQALQRVPGGLRLGLQGLVDLRQRGVPIHPRLACAEQVEVGAMQDQQFRHGGHEAGKGEVWRKRLIVSSSAKLRVFQASV
ncbi:hypothetical protein D3C72_2416380 [compost metagenome]